MLPGLWKKRSAILDGLPGNGAVIVTVHGTNDADPKDDGLRWWQRGSTFTTQLARQLGELGVSDVQILPIHWSGANSDHDRLAGAAHLSRTLAALDVAGRPHAIIGHSHGGNVVMEALALSRRSQPLSSIITFGTPFFARRLKPVAKIIAIFQLLMGATLAPIMIWFLATALMSDTNKWLEAIVLFEGLGCAAVLSGRKGYMELSRSGRSLRRTARAISPADWLVVHSPRDEAMRLLEAAVALSPTYVTVHSAIRSISRFATLAGVAGVFCFFATTGGYFVSPILAKAQAGEFGLGAAADLTFLFLVPVIYLIIASSIRLAARLGGGRLYASALNALLHGSLVGAAYGGDGRFRLTHVLRVPPYLSGARQSRIDAVSLGGIDDTAISSAAQDLYAAVLANENADLAFADPDLLWKRLSDSLYHNAYMRDASVIAHVADHLAVRLRG